MTCSRWESIKKLNQFLKSYITFEDSFPFFSFCSCIPSRLSVSGNAGWSYVPLPKPTGAAMSASWWLHSSDRVDDFRWTVRLVGASFTQQYKKASHERLDMNRNYRLIFLEACGCWKETLFFLLRLKYLNCKIILLLLFKLVFRHPFFKKIRVRWG